MKTYIKTLAYAVTLLMALAYTPQTQAGNIAPEKKITKAKINQADENGKTILHHAIQKCDVDDIRLLIRLGANIEAQTNDGNTALHLAAQEGKVEVIKALLDAGANVEAQANDGRIALHLAAQEGKVEVVKTLVGAEANIEAQDDDERTALHLAAQEGKVEVIKALLDERANVEAQDKIGRTALHLAAQEGKVETLQSLIGAGINTEVQDNNGRTALHVAALLGQVQAIQALTTAGANVEALDNDERTALHWTAHENQAQALRALIVARANIEARDNNGRTPLHWAIQCGRIQGLQALINIGADIEIQDNNGRTALHIAALLGKVQAIQTLIAAEANIQALDTGGKTALHWAVHENQIQALQALIAAEANIEARDNNGRTPLHIAAQLGWIKVMQALIDARANIEAQDKKGRTALHMVAQSSLLQALQVLIEAGANLEAYNNDNKTALHIAAQLGWIKAMQALIDARANIEAHDNKGRTALHVASYNGQAEVVRALIAAGINIEHQDNNGNTALHMAAVCVQKEAIRMLQELGTNNLSLVNKAGRTPFMVALKKGHVIDELLFNKDINGILENGYTQLGIAATHGDIEMMQLLIGQGASVSARDKKGYTAKDRAHLKGQEAVIQFLAAPENNLLLKSASRKGDLNHIKEFLEAGAQINAADEQGHPAIYHAAIKGRIQAVEYLLEQGADLSLLDNRDLTLIQILLTKYELKYNELLKQLLAFQINMHLLDEQGCTLLHQAASHADVDFIEFLLEQGIGFSIEDKQGQLALHAAVLNADVSVLDYLIRTYQHIKNTPNKAGETVVHQAARLGSIEALNLCWEYELNFLAVNNQNQTPLDIAQQANHPHEVIEVIQEGMRRSEAHLNEGEMNQRNDGQDLNPDINTLLQRALDQGNIPSIYNLMRLDVDVGLINNTDLALLRKVLTEYEPKYIDLLKQLVELHQNIHTPDEQGNTLLHLAARYGDVPALNYLIRQGLAVDVCNHKGQTIVHQAVQNSNTTVLRHLIDHYGQILNNADATGGTPAHLAARMGTVTILKHCQGLDFTVRNPRGQTPLVVAIQVGRPQEIIEVIKTLMPQNQPRASPRPSLTVEYSRQVRLVCQKNKNTTQEHDEQLNCNFGGISDQNFSAQALTWDDEDDDDAFPGNILAIS